MLRCPSGHENVSGKFCSECGAPLSEAAPSAATGAGSSPSDAPPPTLAAAATHSPPPGPGESTIDGPPQAWPGTTDATPPAPPPKKPRGRILLVAGAIVVALGIAAAAVVGLGLLGGEETETITGTFTLFDLDGVDGGLSSCQGTGGYSDVGSGMDVTVRDAEGTIVGSSSVHNMTETELRTYLAEEGSDDGEEARSADEIDDMLETLDGFACPLAFEVEVESVDFYEIKIGRRGELSASRKELENDDWKVNYTLGD